MGRSALIRISLGLVALTCSLLLGLDLLGVVPRVDANLVEARLQVSETLALQATDALAQNDYAGIRSALLSATRRNDDVLSAGLRDERGRLIAATGNHATLWDPPKEKGSSSNHARIPLIASGKSRGEIEVRFADSTTEGGFWANLWAQPLVKISVFMGLSCFFVYAIYLRRTLRFLDPSAVIPKRVQAAFDVMSEGVLLLDTAERVVLANEAFGKQVGEAPEALLGRPVTDFEWLAAKSTQTAVDLPWKAALDNAESTRATPLTFDHETEGHRTFMVSGAPVLDGKGRAQGAIATFDDVTELEQKTEELEKAMVALEKSRDEIRLQNEELSVLASSDPMTGAANRRTFMPAFDAAFSQAREGDLEMSCMMVDIDHFKLVNDNHGHATGDAVIISMAGALLDAIGDREQVCRYGGEEFCLLLWGASPEKAMEVGEQIRARVAESGFTDVPITASFGVSSVKFGADTPAAMIEQADAALYHSKNSGRNQVNRFDEVPPGESTD